MAALLTKLNETCRKALDSAMAYCSKKGNANVELEHFLLKLLEFPYSDIHQIIRYYEIDIHTILKHIQASVEKIPCGHSVTLGISSHLLTTLEQSWLISSLNLGQNHIRSAAILLALIDVDILRGISLEICPLFLRISRSALRKDIQEIIQNNQEEAQTPSISSSVHKHLQNSTHSYDLECYTLNLIEKAKQNLLDPVFGRDQEIGQMIDILCRRRQNNPILVGESGVGKTAIVEGLAQKIVNEDVPASLQKTLLYSLDLGALLSGISFKGEIECRFKHILHEISHAPHPIILFIDEIHTLMSPQNSAGLGDLSNFLKPFLTRGELQIIAATTWGEYKRFFEKDSALARRFGRIRIQEPSLQKAVEMVRVSASHLQRHHNVQILSEAIESAVYLSHRFLPERRLPDKALCILDTACAQVSLSQKGIPHSLQEILSNIDILEIERKLLQEEVFESYKNSHNEQRITEINERLLFFGQKKIVIEKEWEEQKKLVSKIHTLKNKLKQNLETSEETGLLQKNIETLREKLKKRTMFLVKQDVDRHAIAKVISEWTGIPQNNILSRGSGWKESELLEVLKTKIIGQVYPLQRIVQTVLQYQAGLREDHKPIGVCFLAGPTGVGKTESAIALSEVLMGHKRHLIRLNMNEFQEPHTVAILKGAPPGYVGYGKGGTLTEAVRQNPYSVILMDEVDKAHPDVLNLFCQIFDKGSLEDSEGIEVDFTHTLFILTSNDGARIIQERTNTIKETEDMERVFDQLTSKVRVELVENYGETFIGRTTVIPYFSLRKEEIQEIFKLKLERIENNLFEKHGVKLNSIASPDENLIQELLQTEQGARSIEGYISQYILPKLAQALNEEKEFKKAV